MIVSTILFFFFKQKTAYDVRISDWSSDVCSSDLPDFERRRFDGREAVQVLVDGSDTVVQAAAIQLAQLPLDTRPVANVKSERTGGGQIGVVSFYNPERRSAVNIVPGLIG